MTQKANKQNHQSLSLRNTILTITLDLSTLSTLLKMKMEHHLQETQIVLNSCKNHHGQQTDKSYEFKETKRVSFLI